MMFEMHTPMQAVGIVLPSVRTVAEHWNETWELIVETVKYLLEVSLFEI